ncbi:MAG: SdrD B-like domain-containing protein [Saprospiraceae bacterium]
MNRGLLTSILCTLFVTTVGWAANPNGDLRIQMLDYYNLVVDHNIQTPAGASPKSVYIGVKICNDGGNDMTDAFAYIGNYNAGTPGIYPTTTPSGMPYSGTFSFTHEGGTADATRFIGNLAGGQCVTQYWLVSYPLVDANNKPVFGSKPDQTDDLHLTYDVWASAKDNGVSRIANDSKTVQLRAEISASSNKIWPNNANQVPSQYRNAFPDKQLGWRMVGNPSQPGSTFTVEGIWFRLGNVNKGFDNDGDFQKDYNFLLQPIGDPSVFDPKCFRLVKVSGLIVIKLQGNQTTSFEFEDQMHFEDMPTNNTDIHGMVFYEFAVLNGPCTSQVTPYQEAASGQNTEKFNSDFGACATMTSVASQSDCEIAAVASIQKGNQLNITFSTQNSSSQPIGSSNHNSLLVLQGEIPAGTEYVGSTAANGNTLPSGTTATVLYSTDNGQSWTKTEPVPASSVTNVEWWLNKPLQPGQSAQVTLGVNVPIAYANSTVEIAGGLSIGGADPFSACSATTIVVGGYTIDGTVFADNGAGNGVLGNGVKEGSEPGLGNVTVRVYDDTDNDGVHDTSDPLVATATSASNGTFNIENLALAKYFVVVDENDTDIPSNYVNTTRAKVYLVDIANGNHTANFGFAPILKVTNTLTSSNQTYESQNVTYEVAIQNLSYSQDEDNSCTTIAWASQLDPATNWEYNKNNLLGAPDVHLAYPSTWSKTAKVKGFDFSGQTGNIEKVELIFSICLDYSVYNDYLVISFQKEDGTTVVVPDPGLGKYSTPSINDFVGPPNIGFIILDVTQYQDWTWDMFDANWAITMNGVIVNSNDGAHQYTDAIGVRVTSDCGASSSGEPGNACTTVDELPFTYHYDQTKLQYLSSTVPPSSVSNGKVTFNNLAPLYPSEVKNINLTFKALNPGINSTNNTVTTKAVATYSNDCDAQLVVDSSLAQTVTIANLGSVTGYVFGDADGDGWKGVYGYETGVDNFIPNVKMKLYGCVNNSNNLIYPAGNSNKSCTHSNNGGHWQLMKADTTGDDGKFFFTGVANGYYYIELDETSLTNSANQTADPDKTNGLAGSSADAKWKNPSSSLKYLGIVGIGNDHYNVNFGYHVQSTISGTVWEDVNGNEIKDASEQTIANAPLEFVHSGCTAGSNCPVILTNGSGQYTFTEAVPGVQYTVSVHLDDVQGAESWIVTYEPDGSPNNSFPESVATGQQLFDQNVGLQASGDLNMGGIVYYDWMGNAHRNAEDEGIGNVEMKLYLDVNKNGEVNNGDQLIQTLHTNSDGSYLFANKPAGSYVITLEENSLPIFPKQTEDPDEYGPCTVCDAKTAISDASFTVSVTDNWNYYNQQNANCEICDEGYTSTNDPPYASNNLDILNFTDPIGSATACITELAVTFNVAASDFEKSYSTSQVDNINYYYPIELNGVQIGTFNPKELPYWCNICESITLVFPVNLAVIPYNFGGNNTLDVNFRSFNQSKPSNQRQDICVADIQMEFRATSCSGNFLELDFGYQPSGGEGEVSGYVFLDANANGVKNTNESKIANIEVQLQTDRNNDGIFNTIETTTTNANGDYLFDELLDGTYKVIVNKTDTDLPTGEAGENARLTTLENHTVEIEDAKMVSNNGVACTNNCANHPPAFGFTLPGSATGFVFSDDNANGTQDQREEGLANVRLYICNTADGYCDATNALDTVITTDGSGANPIGYYLFPGLEMGSYTIAVDPTTVPDRYDLTADPSTDGIPCYSPLDINDPNFDFLSAECDHQMKNIELTFGIQFAGADFGYQPPGCIGGTVWFDDDENGNMETDEDGICETKLEITNTVPVTDGTTSYNPGEFVDSTFTDNDGVYVFTNIPDGTFEIEVFPADSTTLTYDVDGFYLDSLVVVTVDSGEVTSISNPWCTGECSLEIDFGITNGFIHSLSGIACLDWDEDGRCDTGGETFPEGTIVNITDTLGVSYGQTTVAADGSFFFDNLPPIHMVVSVSKTAAPLRLTSLTTSLGDTPAYDVKDSENNAYQYVAVNGDITDMHYGFTFSDTFDVGDLPPPYITRVDGSAPGPAHIFPAISNLYLGNLIDAESEPSIISNASGDDANGVDDEDGITFSTPANWLVGPNGGSLTANVHGTGHLVAWADFNNDGDFDDTNEMLIDAPVATGNTNFSFTIPTGTDLTGGTDIFFRFRLFEQRPFSPATSYNGIVENGEVEDYMVSICKNLTNAGTIEGAETGCNGFDPTAITESTAISGGSGTIEYQWQQSIDGGVTWTDIPGATSSTYDPGAITQTTRYRRNARRSRCGSFISSNTVTKTVLTNFTDPGLIVGDEDFCGIFDPDIILNVLAPSGGTGIGTVSYQWQQSTDGGTTWLDIANANSEFYNPGIISQTTKYRRGSRKSPCGVFLYSNEITKMVAVNYTSSGTIGGDESVCGSYDPSNIVSLSLPGGGTDGYQQYQWELSTDGGVNWTNISGALSETYDPGVIAQTTKYRRKARRTPCAVWVNSNIVTKEVRNFPVAVISNAPTSISGNLCELTDYEFKAADAGAGAAYSWNFGSYATPATLTGRGSHYVQFDVPNGTALTSTSVTLTTTLNGCVSNDSKSLTFRPEIQISNVTSVHPNLCKTNNGSITISATYPAGTSVEYSVDGGANWVSNNYIQNLGAGVYEVRVRYVGGDCYETFGIVTLSDPPPAANILVSSSEECTGSAVTVQAVATTGTPSFTWVFGNSATPSTATGAGPHIITFANGGAAPIAVTMEDGACIGVSDTTIAIVENYTNGGSILGGETLCNSFDPAPLLAGANPSGGSGGTTVYQWEYREDDGAGGWTSWMDVTGANAASFDPSSLTKTTQYRRKVRRAPCPSWIYSNELAAILVKKPNLGDDNYFTVCPGFPHTDNVMSNDLNLSNPTLSILTQPTNGSLDMDTDGEFIYNPNTTFCGTDEFIYFVCNDGTGCCDTAQVVIDLTDTNAPSIVNVPPNITISCDDQVPLAQAVEVVENCQAVSLGMDEFITQGTDSCALHNYQKVRIWNGVDYCTNNASAQQIVTIEDNTAPDIYRIYTLPNGKRMVAGVMENVSEHWKTVKLPVQFTTQPIIFAQVTTRNEATPVVVRLRNISTTQFQLHLAEEEANDGTHLKENVAWVAFEKGAMGGSDPFEVGSWLLNGSPVNKTLGQSYPGIPDFFAAVQTNNDGDPVNPRIDNLATGSVDIWIAEETSLDGETTHNLETVGYLAMYGTGDVKTITGEVIGESGKVTTTTSLQSIALKHKYHNPVVIIGAIGVNEHEPVTARVVNVTASSFSVQLEEFDYQNGTHQAENLSYLVIEGSLPFDRTVSCNSIPAPLQIGTEIVAVDNCDATIKLTRTDGSNTFDCQTDTTFTRTWFTIDDCGNATELVQTYLLIDTIPPTFTVPATATIVCNDNKDNLNLTGDVTDEADNCAILLDAVYTDNLANLFVCNGYIIRTWTLEDDCGNITSKQQLIYVAPQNDNDHDGVVDYFDLDDDNDGIPDAVETNHDDDGDGIPNDKDLDSDNDGIPDLIEIGGIDTNGDGVIDNVGGNGWDHDNDGFAFEFDGNDIDTSFASSVTINITSVINDRDGDGIPNFLDHDSDNDGIPDLVEIGGVDTNGDGIIDYPVPGDPTSMVDNDHDGFNDHYDPDDDNVPGPEDTKDPLVVFDGNNYGGGLTTDNRDADGDTVPDFLDSDSDNDGIADLIEAGGIDTDGDGRIEMTGTFVDINGDGYHDVYASNPLIVTDGDGAKDDDRAEDTDGNGTVFIGGDQDRDGVPNHRDTDSDNDGILDTHESGTIARDDNSDGRIDNFSDTNYNGFDDVAEGSSNILTETDGSTIDGRPEDSGDADETAYLTALPDGSFASGNGNPDVDDDGDNILNFLDSDSDNDLLYDMFEDKNHNGIFDSGETDLYNADTDNDSIFDGVEDSNHNGIFEFGETDPLNPDTDGDLFLDGEEDLNADGVVNPTESDPLNPCDPMLSDQCRGPVVNVKVKLLGGLVGADADTTNIMRDDLRFKNIIPTKEPYTLMTHIQHIGLGTNTNGGSGSGTNGQSNTDPNAGYKESISPGLMYITGNDAPVDWVLVELRDPVIPDSIIATRAAVLQADGDVRDLDGYSYVTFTDVRSGEYYVSVRHRNHLGVMSGNPYLLSPQPTFIDFTDAGTELHEGDKAMAKINGERAMWPGDFSADGKVIFQGPHNDILYLFHKVITSPLNTGQIANFIEPGYSQSDLNMDGLSIFQGPGNDRAQVLLYATMSTAENYLGLANFILFEKLP